MATAKRTTTTMTARRGVSIELAIDFRTQKSYKNSTHLLYQIFIVQKDDIYSKNIQTK